jgi:hypothetical protein
MHPWWQGFKSCFVTLAALPLFMFSITNNKYWLYSLSFSGFIYPPVLPILFLTAGMTWVLDFFRKKELSILALASLLGSGILFVVFYKLTGNGGVTVSGFAPSEWLTPAKWFRYLPAMMMKSFFIPVVAICPVLIYLFTSCNKRQLKVKTLIPVVFMYLVCMAVWMAFIKNIDANQSFLLLFTPVVGLSVGLLIILFWIKKRFILVLALSLLFMVPELIEAFSHNSPVSSTGVKTSAFLKKVGSASILYITAPNELHNVYQFNERVYTGIDHFILDNPSLNLFSTVAASITDTTKFNPITLSMYQTYRAWSPYFKVCNYVNPFDDCFEKWVELHEIQYICARPQTKMSPNWIPVSVDSDYIFYHLVDNQTN